MNQHRDAVGADFAILVAREFVGFVDDPDNESATILKECKVQGERRVSLMQLEAVEELYEAVHQFGYPLPTLREVLSRVETPASKMETIESMSNPTEGFDYSRLMEEIWSRQGHEARGDTVPYKAVYQQGPWNDEMDFDDFDRHVIALDTLATGHISVMEQTREIYLRQSPDKILEAMERRLRGQGYKLPGPNTNGDKDT